MVALVPKTSLSSNCPVKALSGLSTAPAGVMYHSIFHETYIFPTAVLQCMDCICIMYVTAEPSFHFSHFSFSFCAASVLWKVGVSD